MKLSAQDTTNLSAILSACALGGVESIIIEDGVVRGANNARTFAIISDYNVPKFPQKVGLSRLPAFKQRLELFAGNADTIIEVKESERGEISSFDIAAKRNKAQFRCTSTMLIKAPKSINDGGPAFQVFINEEEQKMLLNAVKVMGGSTIQLIIKKDRSAEIKISDATNDAFSTILSTPVELLAGEQDSVVHCHHADIFYAVMKSNPEITNIGFTVGNTGTITTKVNGHNVVILPKVNEDDEE